jgi:hypothetical protein
MLEQLHYVEPDVLPKVQIGKDSSHVQWLGSHASPITTMSAAEYREYNKIMANTTLPIPGRLAVKKSLQSITRICPQGLDTGIGFHLDDELLPFAT